MYQEDDDNSSTFTEIVECSKKLIDETIVCALKKIAETSEDQCDDWPMSSKMSSKAGLRCINKMMKEWNAEPVGSFRYVHPVLIVYSSLFVRLCKIGNSTQNLSA